jgi:P2 family phage major capsid protein
MKNESRLKFNALTCQIASLNNVDVINIDKHFTVAPSVQQTLETQIQESSEFLKKINVSPVSEMEGEKLGLGVNGPVAGRTDTNDAERTTRNLLSMKNNKYKCTQTNFDSHIGYATVDMWAKFKDFQKRFRDSIVERQALDRIMIGFNGTSAAATTNITNNPMLQDVNKGWLQHMRDDAPENVLNHGATAGKVKVGANGDYKNLDALVFDAKQLLDPWFKDAPDLVAIVGSELMHDKYFPLVNKEQAPSETLAADVIMSQKRIGALPAVTAPFFPANAILITSFNNLSIYFQEEARRRQILDNPKRNRIENYESSNDAYVVENYGKAVLIENIEIAA